MRISKSFTLVPILFLIVQSLSAQWAWGTKADYESMKKRKLLILLNEPDMKTVEYLNKKGKSELAKQLTQLVETSNEQFKNAIENNWKYHAEAEFKTASEILALKKTKTRDYVVMYLMGLSGNTTIVQMAPLFYEYYPFGDAFLINKKSDDSQGSIFRIELIEKFDEGSMYMIGVGMGKRIPDEADMTYALEFSQILIDGFLSNSKSSDIKSQIKENTPQLADLKLAIRSDDLDKDLSASDIDENYSGEFEVVSNERYNEIIVNKEKGYAYIMINRGYQGTQFPVVMQAETGAILAFASAVYSLEKEPAFSVRRFAALSKLLED